MQRINQIWCSSAVTFFKQRMKEKFGLSDYSDFSSPLLINGMYSEQDYRVAISHEGHCKILWCGTDALKLVNFPEFVSRIRPLQHYAKSLWVQDTLKKFGIESTVVPVTSTPNIIDVHPRGDSVYFYYSKNHPDRYGMYLLDKIKAETNFPIIMTTVNTYAPSELKEVYKRCFVGLRLTSHDGLPNTVCELALMGRRSIYNGGTPTSVPYKTVDGILDAIHFEHEFRNVGGLDVATKMHNYLNIGDHWLYCS
jgi:hypothetical protein